MATALLAAIVGLVLSFALVALLRPALPAPWRWAWQGGAVHAALWLILNALLLVVLGRPWFAMAIGLAFLMLLVQVSNAKYHSLREAFVFQDFEYFTDAIRHPRLYIPFLGWWKFAMIAVAVLVALGLGLWIEPVAEGRFDLDGQLGAIGGMCLLGIGLLAASGGGPQVEFMPDPDMRRLGFLACLWRYGWAERSAIALPDLLRPAAGLGAEQPDLLVVQSESFFDARRLYAGIRPEILAGFDCLAAEAESHGRLMVPAWGANTVRSEFAFLSGATESMLGVHRFNPYRRILGSEVVTLAKILKAAGYRTICVHPYPASFYGRDRVFPHLGFDEFVDIRAFGEAERAGPYVSDLAVAEKIKSLMAVAGGPLFVFVITMENHGPLHLEKPTVDDAAALYSVTPPPGCEDLTVYLRHLKNADQMIRDLRDFLLQHRRPARLCWYGDHVPIMADVYRQLGDPDGLTEYVIWNNFEQRPSGSKMAGLHELANLLLKNS
jgi:hypothetical protein